GRADVARLARRRPAHPVARRRAGDDHRRADRGAGRAYPDPHPIFRRASGPDPASMAGWVGMAPGGAVWLRGAGVGVRSLENRLSGSGRSIGAGYPAWRGADLWRVLAVGVQLRVRGRYTGGLPSTDRL